MEQNILYEKMREAALALITEFDIDEVTDVETNCGTTWIALKDGSVYYISCQKAQPEPEEEKVFTEKEGA